ncbi:uncharacterized protein [Drosophila suzukii]|uniref:Uncharacterized protein isoform X2 n=1 Tax=Drosophila suzukii TaxID=28584 RepID=A0ABM4TR24_DROSZ
MGSGAKGQWFKCKEDAKPHATMPTTTTITERTPKDMPCNFLFCDYLELLWPQRFLVTTITINVNMWFYLLNLIWRKQKPS